MKTNSNLPYYIYRTANTLYRWKIPVLPFLIQQFLRVVFCCFIPYKTRIGTRNVHFGHNGMGTVLDYRCVIGNDVRIDQHVTIGIRWDETVAPIIGNNVRIGAGAKILGSIRVGDNARIGANAVVLTDVPEGATAVGVPARISPKCKHRESSMAVNKQATGTAPSSPTSPWHNLPNPN